MTDVQQYRVRMRMSVGGLAPETLREWAFGTLDVLLADARTIDADVAAALGDGDVEFDMQIKADSAQAAMQIAADAVADATRTAAPGARAALHGVPPIEHAEVDRVPIPA